MKTIELSNGGYAVIDDADAALVSGFVWRGHSTSANRRYVKTQHKGKTIMLHRLIMGALPGQEVDHINGNAFDCRRENLRLCDKAQNAWNVGPNAKNKSGYKGVKWCEARHKWYVMISVRGKRLWVGSFDDPREGAIAYDRAAVVYHGQFARTNILPVPPTINGGSATPTAAARVASGN